MERSRGPHRSLGTLTLTLILTLTLTLTLALTCQAEGRPGAWEGAVQPVAVRPQDKDPPPRYTTLHHVTPPDTTLSHLTPPDTTLHHLKPPRYTTYTT